MNSERRVWSDMNKFMLALVLLLASNLARAQLAPTGAHYAGRASDTGHGGASVAQSGGLAASIPLDLPAPRAGIPLPLDIVYGKRGAGAVGSGWDIPLSFVQQRSTFAQRRPSYGQYVLPTPRQRTFISLLGQESELVQDGADWVARFGTRELRARRSGGNWMVWDGAGRTYEFVQSPQFSSAGLWLLKSIEAPGRTRLTLTYQLNTWPLSGGSGLAIDLVRLAYDSHPAVTCDKHEIALGYGAPAASPIAMAMLGELAVVRMRTLTTIDVLARATCSAPPQRLRRYAFTYLPDADSRLPRLASVRQFGRQGTAQENVSLPVAEYGYGSASQNSKLNYAISQTIALPADSQTTEVSSSVIDSNVVAPGGDKYATWQSLTDVTGDGRADLIFKKSGKLYLAHNRPAVGGKTSLGIGLAPVPLHDTVFQSGAFSTHSASQRRFNLPAFNNDSAGILELLDDPDTYVAAHHNVVDAWREAIDVNGDGRLDIIDAAEEPLHWVIYLNTPGGLSGVKWVRRSFSVSNLALELTSRGHALKDNRVPLSRRSTSGDVKISTCWRWDESDERWVWFDEGWGEQCFGTPGRVLERSSERTYVEWQLTDVNADGYPDFIYDSTPVRFKLPKPTEEPTGGAPTRLYGDVLVRFEPGTGNALRVAYNVVGVRFGAVEQNPFARSVTMGAPSPESSVALWQSGMSGTDNVQRQSAGLLDVNGDGLVDRVVGTKAYLGVYIGTARTFSPVHISLPDVMSEQRSERDDKCDTQARFTSRIVRGLRDLNGDGYPDYIQDKTVRFGTGAGFVPSMAISSPANFVLSHQTEECDGSSSKTDGGVYDLDGDGQPEVVGLGSEGGSAIYLVSQLVAGGVPRIPGAGRLVVVENGYGARNLISYVSAKEDRHSAHQVPFPEIVVATTRTEGLRQLGGDLSGVRYAYGNAELRFDSASDGFVFAGYQRRVELYPYGTERAEAAAVVTDYWPLTPFLVTSSARERWLRTQRVGRVRDVYTLRGSGTDDPWTLLGVNANDTRVIGVLHQDWDARLFAAAQNTTARDCIDVVLPYNYPASAAANAFDACKSRGFVHATASESWYGPSPPPSTNNIQTWTRSRLVDDFGRATVVELGGDRFRSDDDACVETQYAEPVAGTEARVLTAIASTRVTDCGERTIYARQTWQWDGLPFGQVREGRSTSNSTERRATDNGALLRTVKGFDAQYDTAGNASSITLLRDGLSRTASFEYDPFGIAVTRVRTTATGVPAGETSQTLDPFSLDSLVTTDLNQTRRGVEYDGFGRVLKTTLAVPGDVFGVMSTSSYLGFDSIDPDGRRIASKTFSMPVPAASVDSARGRLSTLHLDELGRQRRVELSLGSDYANDLMVVGARNYDSSGRVAFEADPFPKSADAGTAYGTSFHYKRDGEPACFVRGRGPQPLTTIPDAATERFPTCFQRLFENHLDTLEVRDAPSLTPGSPQAGVALRAESSAIGRPLRRLTTRAGTTLDLATFTQDRLGQTASMTRYGDPAGASLPVTWRWRMDSTGKVLRSSEPQLAERSYEYSDWGELTEVSWLDNGAQRALVSRFDALGRPTETHERTGGTVDPETVATFHYDTAASANHGSPKFLAGRLARASTARGSTLFGYDAYGFANLRIFTDEASTEHVESRSYLADGTMATLEFRLPDNAYAPEVVKYSHDSAARIRSISFVDSVSDRLLYQAEVIDTLGRELKARRGETLASVDHAEDGRKLLKQAIIESPVGARQMFYLGYDSIGREQSRREIIGTAATGPKTNVAYDALGRLSRSIRSNGTNVVDDRGFRYDALGNLVGLDDNIAANDASLSYDTVDRDRLCRIGYGNGGLGGTACNVVHDASGNVTSQPTRTGTRLLDWYASGQVRAIASQGAQARFGYGPFGELETLEISGAGASDRRDRRFGGLMARRESGSGGSASSTLVRRIPGPGGIVATRHGKSDDWTFEFAEARGNRYFTNADGAFVQQVDYAPFGEATTTGAGPGDPRYISQQWNDGDALAPFGLNELGARLYDPVIGRFLGRDPIRIVRGAATTNPYAFAMNDPLNGADPTGLDGDIEGPDPMQPLFDFNFGGSGNPGGCSGGPCTPVPPAPDYWNSVPPTPSGSAVIASDLALKKLALNALVSLGKLTGAQASRAFQDYLSKQVHSDQHQGEGRGFCACGTRQIALKYAGIIQLGKSYADIKAGLAGERSAIASEDGKFEYWHFNETKVNNKFDFSNPQKLGPNAISQIAQNSKVGTGSTERLRWQSMSKSQAQAFTAQGGLVAVMTSYPHHWLTVIRDPFLNRYIFIDPYRARGDSPSPVLTSRWIDHAPQWSSIMEYHGLVHE